MRVTIHKVKEMKRKGQKIPMVTAYDYPTGKLIDEAGIPMVLVGDSLGQVVLGYDSTVHVTMEEMLHHVRAVARGVKSALVVADMPFMSYQPDIPTAIRNAGRFLQEGGAHAVKLEGGEVVAETVQKIVSYGIPVMGHIGLTPQSVNQLSGYRVQAHPRTPSEVPAALRSARHCHQRHQPAIVAAWTDQPRWDQTPQYRPAPPATHRCCLG